MQRGSAGRFQLRTGTSAWVDASDPIAGERFVVVADLDGKRKDARIRLAAALDADEVSTVFAHEVESRVTLEWVDDRLVERRVVRLGGMVLDEREQRAQPGPDATAAVVARLRDRKLADLPWTDAAKGLRDRVAFLRASRNEEWPDWSTPALVASVEEWLVPYLGYVSTIRRGLRQYR